MKNVRGPAAGWHSKRGTKQEANTSVLIGRHDGKRRDAGDWRERGKWEQDLKQFLPMTLIMVLNLSRSQSIARILAICVVSNPTAFSTITMVTKPAEGIPAAPEGGGVNVKSQRYGL